MSVNKIKKTVLILVIIVMSLGFAVYGTAENGTDSKAAVTESDRLKQGKQYLNEGRSFLDVYSGIVFSTNYGADLSQVMARYSETLNWDVVQTELAKTGTDTMADGRNRLFHTAAITADSSERIEKDDSGDMDIDWLREVFPGTDELISTGCRPEDIFVAYNIAHNYLKQDSLLQEILDTRILFGENWNTLQKNMGINIIPGESKTMTITADTAPASDEASEFTRLEWKYNIPQKKLEQLKNSEKSTVEIEQQLFEEKVQFYCKREVSRQEVEQADYYADMYQESLDRVLYFWRKYSDWNSVAWALYR